jgi:Arginase/agmatinase/formimionoglutamate hydrolase, arginase family
MDIQLLLVPYDTARRRWRSGAGPEHLLENGLTTHLHGRGHSVADIQVIDADPNQPPAEIGTAFELMRRIAVAVRAVRAAGHFPVVLSGNCNSAVGTLSGLTPARRAVFWFDAHADCNTPDTTATGFLDGTGLATALGLCWHQLTSTMPGYRPVQPEATFLLGARDLDLPEAALLARSAITVVSTTQIPASLPELLARAPLKDALGYLHLDLDVLDPAGVGQANSLPVPGGLSVEQMTAGIAAIRARVPLGAAAIASYAPEYDSQQGVCRAAFAALDAILADVARPTA